MWYNKNNFIRIREIYVYIPRLIWRAIIISSLIVRIELIRSLAKSLFVSVRWLLSRKSVFIAELYISWPSAILKYVYSHMHARTPRTPCTPRTPRHYQWCQPMTSFGGEFSAIWGGAPSYTRLLEEILGGKCVHKNMADFRLRYDTITMATGSSGSWKNHWPGSILSLFQIPPHPQPPGINKIICYNIFSGHCGVFCGLKWTNYRRIWNCLLPTAIVLS